MEALQLTYENWPEQNQLGIENFEQKLKLAFSLFLPKENISISEYAAKYRILSKEESVRSGLWDNTLAPFAVEIMDSFLLPHVYEIDFMGSAQVVKTEVIKNVMAYFADIKPTKLLLLYPTEDAGRAFSKEKLDPMINSNQRLKGKIAPAKSRDSANRALFKKFIGGYWAIVGSNSPTSLAQRSIQIVLTDDADRTAVSAGQEGDAISLAEQRTESFRLFWYKHGRFSTPTIKDFSKIEKYYLLSDQRQYYVPCPFCNHMQTLIWENLKWDKITDKDLFEVTGKKHLPETAKYECQNPECNILIEEQHKHWMLNNGEWKAKYPDRIHHRGYWINRLYSPFSSWSNIVQEFLEKKDDPETLRTFWNTSLARTWEEVDTETIEDTSLLKRVEDYMTSEKPYMPNDVLVLTCFIDVQGDRLECLVQGYGVDEEQWTITHIKFFGNPELNEVWEEAFEFVWTTQFVREDGVGLQIKRLFVDNGAYTKRVNQVLHFRRKQMHEGPLRKLDNSDRKNFGMWGVKGKGGAGRALIPKTLTRSMGGRLFTLVTGVDEGKTAIYKRLTMWDEEKKRGPKLMHFSKEVCDIDFFEQLTAEKQLKKWTPKGPVIEWAKKKKGARNEVLDMMVGCLAALEHLKPNFDKLKDYYKKVAAAQKQREAIKDKKEEPAKAVKKTRVIKSSVTKSRKVRGFK